MTSSEADVVIDQLLRQAQWNPADKSQVRTEVTVQDLEGRGNRSRPGSSVAASTTGTYRVGREGGGSAEVEQIMSCYPEWASSGSSESKSVPLNPQAVPYAQSWCAVYLLNQRRVDLFLGLSK